MITKRQLIENGFTESQVKDLSFFTRDGFTVVNLWGKWCPCTRILREELTGLLYVDEMSELEELIRRSNLG